ncbi:uncharacterized protein [Montipora capricornis]|uniref:uncharacterized protein isoform X2 n=1 Tax=Montipora capricornis TaxID=246305 RepID=UPI0035F12A51
MFSISCCGFGKLLRSCGRSASNLDTDHHHLSAGEYAEPVKRPVQCTDGHEVDKEQDGRASGSRLEATERNERSKGPIQCTDETEDRTRSTGKESKVKVSVEATSVCGKEVTVTVHIAENEE